MDTLTIQYFLDIADGATYGEVADRYHISQSSISKSIARLESDLGVDLFYKKQHRATLTPAGSEFHAEMQKLAPQFNRVLRNLSRYASHKKISVCAAPSWDNFNMRYRFLMSDFREQHPDIRVELIEYKDVFNCTPEISNDQLDFGVMHLFKPVKNNCEYRKLRHDALWALFPKEHPLSSRPYVTPYDLKEYPLLLCSSTMKHTVKEINSELDFLLTFSDPSNEYNIRRDQMIYRIASDEEQSYTLFFESDIESLSLKNIRSVPVTGTSPYPLVIFWKKGRKLPDYCNIFLDYFCNLISTPEK